jgi:DNA-binding beta-propeller fold protein YncE
MTTGHLRMRMFVASSIVALLGAGLVAPAAQAVEDPPTFSLAWGTSGSADGEFNDPFAVATDAAGDVYVTDTHNHRIQKFDSNGSYLTQWGTFGSGDGEFDEPVGIATDASDNVYITDFGNNRIQKFDSNGSYLTQWGTFGSGDGEFVHPQGVALDAAGNVYVADTANHRIQKFDSNGVYVTKWGTFGSGDGQFQGPHDIATGAGGNVYVVDSANNRIQMFDSNGVYLTQWGTITGDARFDAPRGIATDAAGNVYVADTEDHRIQKFDSNGTYLTQWGMLGSGDGEFSSPEGVATDAAGNVYVADKGNDRIQKFVDVSPPSPLFPSSFTVQAGSFLIGDAASLAADDDDFLVVRSTKSGSSTRAATWYGSFPSVDNATSSLAATYKGLSSAPCTQVISTFRWTDSTWVPLDSRSIGTTEVEVADLTPPGTLADFVSGTSGTGEVRVRISCSSAATFDLSGDLLRLTVGSGGGTQTLTVSQAGTGTGSVTSSPAGINCPGDCSEAYTTGTMVNLTATPDGGSTFTGWSGACTGTGACQVTMNAAASVTATFTGGGGTTDVLPSSFTIEAGSLGGGTAANLNADDNAYLVVRSNKAATRTATWYGSFLSVDNATSSLAATYKGLSSSTCTQVISIFRWTDSTWVQLDSRSIGTSEVEVAGLTPPGTLTDFVSGTSGTGEVRVRISCSASATFNLSGDLLKLVV